MSVPKILYATMYLFFSYASMDSLKPLVSFIQNNNNNNLPFLKLPRSWTLLLSILISNL